MLRIYLLRESGIYDEQTKIAFNPTRVGLDISEKIVPESYETEDTLIEEIEGILFLFLIFNTFSMFLFVFKLFYNQFFSPVLKFEKRGTFVNESVKIEPVQIRMMRHNSI